MSHLSERPVYIVDNSDHFLESLPVVPKEELERCKKIADSMWVENIRRKDKEKEELEQRYKELIDNESLQSDFDFG